MNLIALPAESGSSVRGRAGRLEVCLISMPTATDFEDPRQFEGQGVRTVSTDVPLGTLALAAVLERAGFAPRIVDINRWYMEYLLEGAGRREIPFSRFTAERLAGMDADLYGFSTICNSYPVTLQTAEQLKELRPQAVTLLGGAQASVVDTATLSRFPAVDYILRGEADQSLPEFAQRLSEGRSPEFVPGLTYRAGGEVRRNPDAPLPTDLDTLPVPAFHLYPGMEQIHNVPIELGRGCPFGCTFCSTNDFFRRRFRLKSPAKLIAEMDYLLARYPVTFFDLMHDMFTVDRKRVVATCEAILATGRTYRWGCSARTDCVDEELLELMARAGCVSIFFGIETGSARLQKVIGKRLDLEDARKVAARAGGLGMETTVSLIIGFPDETMDDLRGTMGFIGDSLSMGKATPHLHLLSPLPGTPLHLAHRHELVLEDVCTDISHAGWVQRDAERRLIAAHPDVFPNFYAIPTPHLDRRFLQELREFVVRTSHRFRWMLAAIQQGTGDLLSLFEEWRIWSAQRTPARSGPEMRRYYSTWEFDRHFVEFLESRPAAARGPFEAVLLEFEEALIEALRRENGGPAPAAELEVLESDMRLALAPHVYLLRLNGDLNRVTELLAAHALPDESIHRPTIVATRLISEEDVEVVEVPPLSAQFLGLCDGRATVDEVLRDFAAGCTPVGGMSAWDVATYALQTVYQGKLVRAIDAAA